MPTQRSLKNRAAKAAKAQAEAENEVEETEVEATETEVVETETATVETVTETAPAEAKTPQQVCAEYISAFGSQGGNWFAQGLDFSEAQTKFIGELKAENETLKRKLAHAEESESEPLSGGDNEGKQKRSGFANRIKLPGMPSEN